MVRLILLSSIFGLSAVVFGIPVNNDSAPPGLSKRGLHVQDDGLRKRIFSVRQTQNVAEQFDGASALKKAYLKHGLPLPKGLEKRQLGFESSDASSRGSTQGGATSDVVAISEANDLEYVSPVNVGGTMMRLDFDTGSSDL
jgi:hypothetical protein